jgi:hypothetical protein
MAYEYDGSNWRVTATRRIAVGQHLEIGRGGEMPLGVVVPDLLVSRRAMRVSATAHGWNVTVSNRNGAILHPWCLPPQLARARRWLIDWPLVAVRMLPCSGPSQHWVLLEFDNPLLILELNDRGLFPETDESQAPTTAETIKPRWLTGAEREALHAVFQAQLQWPPTESSEPLLLKQAAARLGISISGVQDRLKSALARALALGQDRTVALTDPSYLYILARAGYMDPPTQFAHRPTLLRPGHDERARAAQQSSLGESLWRQVVNAS